MSSTGSPRTAEGRSSARSAKKRAVYLGVVLLAFLHHDFWFWHDPTLVFGFMPVGLAYHAVYSVVAGLLWYAVLTVAWPSEVEAFARKGRAEKTPPK